ncbi:hypothetical protein EIP86_003848 [Pleurotus ostreatoroseus]|nr:hypothetical protein EIP86_003848 [Pleurotus ostreatoroseus]
MLPARPPFESRPQPDGDAAIRQTDSDAANARFSAVQKGYLTDPFIKPLLPRGAHLQPARPPLINVGTPYAAQLSSYVEIDFPENTTKKAMAIRKSKELSSHLGKPEDVKLAEGGTALYASIYHLLPIDMRRPPIETLTPTLGPILSSSLPTLLIFECVLCYMSPEASAAIVQWFVDHLSAAPEKPVLGGIVYEMFGLGDAFGQVMYENLKVRNVTLPGVEPYQDVPSLPKRFLQHGFTISELEMLDELEELDLVLQHYAITWGVKVFNTSTSVPWSQWGIQPADPSE